MSDAVIVPTWAIALIAGLLGVLLAVIRWALARFTTTVDDRLEKVETAVGGVSQTVGEVDRRLIRVETILGDGGTDPAARRLRILTPPQGVPPP